MRWRGWSLEHSVATKSEAGDTPGLSVVKPFWNEDGVSSLALMSQKNCSQYDNLFTGRRCGDGHVTEEVRNAFYKLAFPSCKQTPDDNLHTKDCRTISAGFISCKQCNYDLVHPTDQGDGLHAMTPVYLRNHDSRKFERLPLEGTRQIQVDAIGEYAFIESQSTIIVINLKTGEVLDQLKGQNANWLPSR